MKLTRKGLIVKIRYLTFSKEGLPYFQRKYPRTLLGHPSLTSTTCKVRLHSNPHDEAALLAEVSKANHVFETYIDTLKSSNTEKLKEIELERKAKA